MKHPKNLAGPLRLISVALAVSISFSVQSQDKKPPYEQLPVLRHLILPGLLLRDW
ncbi:MAG: hypothetical protein WDO15_26225 [Bacteroidota bacterium]